MTYLQFSATISDIIPVHIRNSKEIEISLFANTVLYKINLNKPEKDEKIDNIEMKTCQMTKSSIEFKLILNFKEKTIGKNVFNISQDYIRLDKSYKKDILLEIIKEKNEKLIINEYISSYINLKIEISFFHFDENKEKCFFCLFQNSNRLINTSKEIIKSYFGRRMSAENKDKSKKSRFDFNKRNTISNMKSNKKIYSIQQKFEKIESFKKVIVPFEFEKIISSLQINVDSLKEISLIVLKRVTSQSENSENNSKNIRKLSNLSNSDMNSIYSKYTSQLKKIDSYENLLKSYMCLIFRLNLEYREAYKKIIKNKREYIKYLVNNTERLYFLIKTQNKSYSISNGIVDKQISNDIDISKNLLLFKVKLFDLAYKSLRIIDNSLLFKSNFELDQLKRSERNKKVKKIKTALLSILVKNIDHVNYNQYQLRKLDCLAKKYNFLIGINDETENIA